MLRLRLTSDCQARTKNTQPPHSTTGVASANSIQLSVRGAASHSNESPTYSPIARMTSGTVSTALTQKRRVMSSSSGLSSSSRLTVIGSRCMPHFGHEPGSSRTISGCIGQVYWVLVASEGVSGSSAMPHLGQAPGSGWRTSGCMGQVYIADLLCGFAASSGLLSGADLPLPGR